MLKTTLVAALLAALMLGACVAGLGEAAAGTTRHGKWWIASDQLCQRWTSWMDGKSYCYRLTQTGSSVRWVRNDGASGTARIGG
jgi:hypothetical protein